MKWRFLYRNCSVETRWRWCRRARSNRRRLEVCRRRAKRSLQFWYSYCSIRRCGMSWMRFTDWLWRLLRETLSISNRCFNGTVSSDRFIGTTPLPKTRYSFVSLHFVTILECSGCNRLESLTILNNLIFFYFWIWWILNSVLILRIIVFTRLSM